ncbi:MAG: phosphoglucosamine mutase, partial [bacterium]
PQTVMKLGWAVGSVLADASSDNATGATAGDKILIGKDTRVSGYLLESALEAGIAAAGVNICFLGPLPTPAIAYLTRTARACAGIAVSASHNPYHDNGIKIFSADGAKLDDDMVARIDAKMAQPMGCVDSSRLGKAERLNDAQGRYIEFCKSTLPPRRVFAGIKVVVDCAHGAAYEVAPRVLGEMGAEVVAIGNAPDGFNINRDCGSTDLRALRAAVLEHRADLGIALDGDADRVLMADADGERIDGDQILYLLAERRRERGALGGVVGTAMTNLGLQRALERMDIPFARAQVGDRHVHAMLAARGWLLGGETSGHIICLDKSTTGDGIIAALETLDAMAQTQRSLRELVAALTIYPQRLINVPVEADAAAVASDAQVARAVSRVERDLGDAGRVVLRASGTEPLVRVMIEGESRARVDELATLLADAVRAAAA